VVNMNAVILLGLCALGANAQFISTGAYPYSAYTPNFLHSGAFAHAVGSPITYTIPAPVHTPITYTIPAPVHTPIVAAPVVPVQTQHHAQDELGQFNFGYSGGPSSRHETRDAFGVVRGAFNYIDGDGEVQHQSYVADAAGFRVAGTNLPVAPEVPSGADTIYLNPPKPVEDTPEVATAKAAHERLFNEAAAAALAAPDTPARKKRSVGSVAVHSAVSPLTYGFNAIHPFTGHAVAPTAIAPATPLTYNVGYPIAPGAGFASTYAAGHAFGSAVTYAAPTPQAVTYNAALPAALSTHDATLLRVENNPGHAVSYRVY